MLSKHDTKTQIYPHTDTQIHRYKDTQIHRYTDTQVRRSSEGGQGSSKGGWGRRGRRGGVEPNSTQNLAFCRDRMITFGVVVLMVVQMPSNQS